MARFTDKVVIITGAASGLGLESAVRIGSEGANLVLVDLNEDALEAAKLWCSKPHPRPRS
ncbi:SDR family NAD(P)-dependent oxidoreductase [Kocuria atrinae]|uniref:SDR family NAD(P)-dependent oxidoreductase n=1 Tax=Kocuria atrinae TaxID=592377 RepID=UPI00031A9B5C|nr:SDR family NAD(P)-dependent oxidoreductase [Kocuria atrinae]